MCRTDLNLTCLNQTGQCGVAVVTLIALMFNTTGVTVAGITNSHGANSRASSGTTISGTGVAGATQTQLSHPTSVFVTENSTIYVSDSFNYRTQKFIDGSHVGVTVAGISGTSGPGLNEIGFCYGIYVDSNQTVYVSDSVYTRVLAWYINSSTGVLVGGQGGNGSAANQLYNPHGIYVDELNGYLYIADTSNNRIQQYVLGQSSGVTVAGGNAVGGMGLSQFDYPTDVIGDGKGYLYIADSNNCRVVQWFIGGAEGIVVAGQTGVCDDSATTMGSVLAVAFDKNYSLYAADSDYSRIQKFSKI
ncbi:unnamed protein product [Didymodactylos carnosus]|uniref:NHL repeat containing protein n=1 Tax=Didymodactylos carnosus TaxID=1234261 RepID=A0A815HDY2_9BILA|nr:unnamed protein product [Didymodactylos carnosus]CAF4220757.1 unnamed protein product [Didymodactylos carnosus]